MRIFATILFILMYSNAQAGLFFDMDLSTVQSTRVTTSTSSSTRSLYDFGVLVPIDSKETFYLGASYFNLSSQESAASTTTTFSTQDIVLGFRWQLDNSRIFSISGGYGVLASASFNSGSSTETWQGTSLIGKITAVYPFAKKFGLGVAIIYYQNSYSSRVASNVQSNVAYSNTVILPAVGLNYSW